MPETPTIPDDDALVAQLRAWADDLADRVPTVAAPVAPARRRAWALPAAAALVVALGVAAVVVARPGDQEDVRAGPTTTASTTPVATIPDLPLEGTPWWLEALEVDGEAQELPPGFEPTLTVGPTPCGPRVCPAGTTLGVYDGCNHGGADVTVGPDEVTAEGGASTLMGCAEPVGSLANQVGRITDGTSTYAIEGDVLTLRHDDLVLTYRAGDGPYPPLPDGGAILADVGGPDAHRVTWMEVAGPDGPVVRLEARRSADSRPGGPLAEPEEVDLPRDGAHAEMAAVILRGTKPVVFGLVDARATEVTYEYLGLPVVIPTVALDGVPEVRAFVGEVPARTGWIVRATTAEQYLVASLQGPS